MSDIPNDFVPDLTKDFPKEGFSVQVRYSGEEKLGAEHVHVWWFRIVVDGVFTAVGPYHWPTNERALTNEQAANHIASFYSLPNDKFKTYKPEIEKKDDKAFHGTVAAIALVQTIFYSEEPNKLSPNDFKIVWFAESGADWKAVVATKNHDDRHYEVIYDGVNKQTIVHGYTRIEAYSIRDEVTKYGPFWQ